MDKWRLLLGFLILNFGLTSCLNDETVTNVKYNYKKIDSIQIENINSIREITEIKTFFTQSNSCESFFDYEYLIAENQRIVTIVVANTDYGACQEMTTSKDEILKFQPEHKGKYIFKFWSGVDENGKETYITQELEIF